MNRDDITVTQNGNAHFIGFSLAKPLRHGDSHWTFPSDEYQLHVLDYYGGELMQVKGIKQHAVQPQSIRIWISDKATAHRAMIIEEVLRILTKAA